jgi:hypothetical protein
MNFIILGVVVVIVGITIFNVVRYRKKSNTEPLPIFDQDKTVTKLNTVPYLFFLGKDFKESQINMMLVLEGFTPCSVSESEDGTTYNNIIIGLSHYQHIKNLEYVIKDNIIVKISLNIEHDNQYLHSWQQLFERLMYSLIESSDESEIIHKVYRKENRTSSYTKDNNLCRVIYALDNQPSYPPGSM